MTPFTFRSEPRKHLFHDDIHAGFFPETQKAQICGGKEAEPKQEEASFSPVAVPRSQSNTWNNCGSVDGGDKEDEDGESEQTGLSLDGMKSSRCCAKICSPINGCFPLPRSFRQDLPAY